MFAISFSKSWKDPMSFLKLDMIMHMKMQTEMFSKTYFTAKQESNSGSLQTPPASCRFEP